MALLDILAPIGEPMELYFSRGDVGNLVDIVVLQKNELQIPEVTGGGDEVSFYVYT